MVRAPRHSAVSSLGRFRTKSGVANTPKPREDGYVTVHVNRKQWLMHRLVATIFLQPRHPDCTEVDHLDGNPGNNRVDNLEWVTPQENKQRSWERNPKQTRAYCGDSTAKPVRGRRVGSDEWTIFRHGANQVQRELGINSGGVTLCCAKTNKTASGYEFEYAESTEADVLDGEEWRVTVGGAQVSSLGRFRRTPKAGGVVFTPKPEKSGYVRVMIDGIHHSLHRLVADAFELPKRSAESTEIDHIDRNRSNNRLENLEWVTRAENMQRTHQNNPGRGTSAQRTKKPVRVRPVGTKNWTTYSGGCNEAARALGTFSGRISACCKNPGRTVKGYEFEYAEPTEPDVLPGEEWREIVPEE
jgi:hypothetical protein